MRFLNRVLLACLAALFCSLPVTSADGGGGGDSGVWILPNSLPVMAQPMGNPFLRAPRAERTMATLNTGMTMVMPPQMGAPISQLFEMPTHQPLPSIISGDRVTLTLATLMAIRDGTGLAEGLIIDLNGNGFILRVSKNANGLILQVF